MESEVVEEREGVLPTEGTYVVIWGIRLFADGSFCVDYSGGWT